MEWIASEFNIGSDCKIADFGCGSGLYAARLAKRGANVTGIDFSGRSIEYAKEAAAREQLNIRYVKQNYLEFETEDRFDLVLDKYIIIESDRTRKVYNWLQYFTPEDLEREFIEAGFSVKGLYSDVEGIPYDRKSSEFAIIAHRV